jgi:hypothetical protein
MAALHPAPESVDRRGRAGLIPVPTFRSPVCEGGRDWGSGVHVRFGDPQWQQVGGFAQLLEALLVGSE